MASSGGGFFSSPDLSMMVVLLRNSASLKAAGEKLSKAQVRSGLSALLSALFLKKGVQYNKDLPRTSSL